MGTWSVTVTNKGIALQTKQVKGATISFTRVVSGSGSVSLVNLKEQTAVSGIVQKLSMESLRTKDKEYTMTVLLSNETLTKSYNMTQIGFYANDPDEGEILFAIGQIDTPKAIPTNADSPGYCLEFVFTFKNENDSTIEINPNMAAYVTLQVVDDVVANAKDEVSITGTGLGNPITVDDSADAPFNDITVYGASEQEQTKGYQLFDYDATEFATFSKGGATITNNEDGTFTISGNGSLTSDISAYHYYTHAQTVEMFKAGTLRFKDVANTTPRAYIHPQRNGGNIGTLSISKGEFEITQDMLDDETFKIVIGFYAASGNTIVAGTIKPMLYQDGDGTFEIFTGGKSGPNPDYPLPIESVGDSGSVGLKTTGKNLYNCRDVVSGELYNAGVIADDDFVTIEYDNTAGTTTAYKNFWTYPCQHLKKDTDYRIVVEVKELLNCGFYPVSRKIPTFTESQFTENLIIQQVGTFSEVIHTNDADWTGTVYALRSFVQFSAGMSGKCVFRISLQQVDDTSTEYEPYKEAISTVPLTNPLYGIPVSSDGNYTDESGQQWLCNEIDLARGVYIKRTNTVDLGSLEWSYSADYVVFTALHTDICPNTLKMLCTHYITSPRHDAGSPDMTIYGRKVGEQGGIGVKNSNYTDAATFKTAMSGAILLYELAKPIETPLTAEQISALRSLQTFDPVTNIFADEPATMEVEYFKNTENGKSASQVKIEHNKDMAEVDALLQNNASKNLLKNTATSQTVNGITFTVNDDGSVTCNGTATSNAVIDVSFAPSFDDGTYILSGCPEGGGSTTYMLYYANWSDTSYEDVGNGIEIKPFDVSAYPNARVRIRVSSGVTVENLTFYPMIRKAEITDDTYEPYYMSNKELTEEVAVLDAGKADYEEGEWTAIIAKNASSAVLYADDIEQVEVTGKYVRVGRLCFVSFANTKEFSTTTEGYLRLAGNLPFPMASGHRQIGRVGYGNTPKGTNYHTVYMNTDSGGEWQFEVAQKVTTNPYIDLAMVYLIKE